MKKLLLLPFCLLLFFCTKPKEENPQPAIPAKIEVKTSFKPTTAVIYNELNTTFEIESNVTLSKVEFYFNNKSIGSIISKPYKIDFTPQGFLTGEYDLTAVGTFENKEFTQTQKVKLELKKGDKFKGGRVFHLSDDKLHGLVAAENDHTDGKTTRFNWGPFRLVGANNLNDGKPNTDLIIKSIRDNEFFTHWRLLENYELNQNKGWYVPAYNELNLLRENRQYVSNFPTQSDEAIYWSSTEINADNVYAKHLMALMGEQIKKTFTYKIRLVNKF